MDEPRACIHVAGSRFIVHLNRAALDELMQGFEWLARDQPIGEEVSIHSNASDDLAKADSVVGYLEFNLVERHLHKKAGKNVLKQAADIRRTPHGKYAREYDRMDYFVNVDEIREALQALSPLRPSGNAGAVTIFGNLDIKLMR